MSNKSADSNEAGIGTIEVIASLMILSLSLIPIMNMTRSLNQRAIALQERQVRLEIQQSALAYFRTVNVGQTPRGEKDFGDWSISWNARLVDQNGSIIQNFDNRQRRIGLFEVKLSISYPLAGETRQVSHNVRSVGWSE